MPKKQIALPIAPYLAKFAKSEFTENGVISFCRVPLMAVNNYHHYETYFQNAKHNQQFESLKIEVNTTNQRHLYAIKCYIEEVFHTKFIAYISAQLQVGQLLKVALANFLQQYEICEFKELKIDTLQKRWTRHNQKVKSGRKP